MVLPCPVCRMTGSRRSIRRRWSTTSGWGHTLQMAQVIQAQRDDRRASGSPSRTNQGEAPRSKERKVGTRKQRELTREQLNEAILATAGMRVGSVLKSPLT